MIAAVVNGEDRPLEDATTVGELVAALVGEGRGVAVAVNGEIVARSEWAATPIADGDRIEVLRAAQGGC